MAAKQPFKVVIVGGGIGGLSLAIMLEKFDIDYVLLESHSDIAPALGASMALFPNGLLILDQLGCYEDVKAQLRGDTIKTSYVRDVDGMPLMSTPHLLAHLEQRHGYPMLFFERQWLLRLLYNRISQKHRVLTGQKVKEVITSPTGVEVCTAAGLRYQGDIVIGADGIHSAVRREMFRLADKMSPGYFSPKQDDGVPCHYQCSFGIARDVEAWSDGEQCFTLGHGHSFLIAPGPNQRVFWFLFSRLPETLYGKDIPRYTKEDEAAFVAKNRNLPITEKLTFGQLYDKRISSTLTAIHEVVYKKWYFDRILVIGDAAHKPNPIAGMGGNGAIESAAELVNALVERKNKGRLDGLTSKEVQAIGKQVQDVRHKRARFIIALSHKMQAVFACENNLLSRILWHVIGPMAGEELPVDLMVPRLIGGNRLRHLPIPRQPRSIPYDHELPAKPWRSKLTRLMAPCFTVTMGGVVLYLSRGNRVSPISEFYNCTEPFISWLRNSLHQVELSQITRAIGPAQYTGVTLPMGYFLSQLMSPILIFTVEGHRVGNRLSPLALPSLFNGALQTLGLGRATAIHAIFSGFAGFGTPAGRRIRPEVAKSLIPAISLGYVLPISLLLMYPGNLAPWKRLVWYLSPICVSTLSRVLPALQSPWRKKKAEKSPRKSNGTKDPLFGRYSLTDVSPLKLSYDFAFALQAAAHVAALVHGYRPARLALYELNDTAILFSGTFDVRAYVLSMIPGLLLHDAIFGVIPVMMSNLYTVWDLRRRGNITTWQAMRATLGVVVGQFLVGPGATWALLWRWRESKIVSLSIT